MANEEPALLNPDNANKAQTTGSEAVINLISLDKGADTTTTSDNSATDKAKTENTEADKSKDREPKKLTVGTINPDKKSYTHTVFDEYVDDYTKDPNSKTGKAAADTIKFKKQVDTSVAEIKSGGYFKKGKSKLDKLKGFIEGGYTDMGKSLVDLALDGFMPKDLNLKTGNIMRDLGLGGLMDTINMAKNISNSLLGELIKALLSLIHIPDLVYLASLIAFDAAGSNLEEEDSYIRKVIIKRDITEALKWWNKEWGISYGLPGDASSADATISARNGCYENVDYILGEMYDKYKELIESSKGVKDDQVKEYEKKLIALNDKLASEFTIFASRGDKTPSEEYKKLEKEVEEMKKLKEEAIDKYERERLVFLEPADQIYAFIVYTVKLTIVNSYSGFKADSLRKMLRKFDIKPSYFGKNDDKFKGRYAFNQSDIDIMAAYYTPAKGGALEDIGRLQQMLSRFNHKRSKRNKDHGFEEAYIDPRNMNIKRLYLTLVDSSEFGNDIMYNPDLAARLKLKMMSMLGGIIDSALGAVIPDDVFLVLEKVWTSAYDYTKEMQNFLWNPASPGISKTIIADKTIIKAPTEPPKVEVKVVSDTNNALSKEPVLEEFVSNATFLGLAQAYGPGGPGANSFGAEGIGSKGKKGHKKSASDTHSNLNKDKEVEKAIYKMGDINIYINYNTDQIMNTIIEKIKSGEFDDVFLSETNITKIQEIVKQELIDSGIYVDVANNTAAIDKLNAMMLEMDKLIQGILDGLIKIENVPTYAEVNDIVDKKIADGIAKGYIVGPDLLEKVIMDTFIEYGGDVYGLDKLNMIQVYTTIINNLKSNVYSVLFLKSHNISEIQNIVVKQLTGLGTYVKVTNSDEDLIKLKIMMNEVTNIIMKLLDGSMVVADIPTIDQLIKIINIKYDNGDIGFIGDVSQLYLNMSKLINNAIMNNDTIKSYEEFMVDAKKAIGDNTTITNQMKDMMDELSKKVNVIFDDVLNGTLALNEVKSLKEIMNDIYFELNQKLDLSDVLDILKKSGYDTTGITNKLEDIKKTEDFLDKTDKDLFDFDVTNPSEKVVKSIKDEYIAGAKWVDMTYRWVDSLRHPFVQ